MDFIIWNDEYQLDIVPTDKKEKVDNSMMGIAGPLDPENPG